MLNQRGTVNDSSIKVTDDLKPFGDVMYVTGVIEYIFEYSTTGSFCI